MAKKRVRPARKAKRAPAAAARPRPSAPPAPTSDQLALIERLSNVVAVSGDEGAVRTIVLEAVEGQADSVQVDALGNVLVTKRGRSNFRVLIAAHMDEVGFMVTWIDSDGTCRFDLVGGVDERQLLGRPVWIGKNQVPGIIGGKPIHLVKGSERNNVVKVDAMRIDLGVTSKDAAQALVKVGDRGTFATTFSRFGSVLRGKALDDRLGCAALIELLRGGPYEAELIAAFTVQEEVGLRGARVAGYRMEPDAAIALDSTPANDLPTWDGTENVSYNTRLGQGPAIYLADRSTISDAALVEHLTQVAEEAGIPYQFRQPGGGGTDAGALQLARNGVPVVSVSVPGRYPHTAAALATAEDWANTLRLLQTALTTLGPKTLKRL